MVEDWAEWLQAEEELQSARLRQRTHTGGPCGGEAFLQALERLLARPVQPQQRGRKPTKVLVGRNEQSVPRIPGTESTAGLTLAVPLASRAAREGGVGDRGCSGPCRQGGYRAASRAASSG